MPEAARLIMAVAAAAVVDVLRKFRREAPVEAVVMESLRSRKVVGSTAGFADAVPADDAGRARDRSLRSSFALEYGVGEV